MAYEAGDLPQPGKHNVLRFPVTTAKTITKGNFYRVVAGDSVLLATATTTELGVFEAVETKVIAAGDVPTTVEGVASGKVVAASGGVIKPNGYIQIETGSAEVKAATAANLAAGLVIGRYIKVAGADTVGDAADGDKVVIDLGAA